LIRKENDMDLIIPILTVMFMAFPWFTTIMLFTWIRENDEKHKKLQEENIELRFENRKLFIEKQKLKNKNETLRLENTGFILDQQKEEERKGKHV